LCCLTECSGFVFKGLFVKRLLVAVKKFYFCDFFSGVELFKKIDFLMFLRHFILKNNFKEIKIFYFDTFSNEKHFEKQLLF
jgi:hypothetical protein